MNKKCLGCGSILQSIDKDKEGYIIEKVIDKAVYCERCFKSIHYNESKEVNKVVTIDDVIKSNETVILLIDVLTLSNSSIDLIKSINNNLYIVLTKMDLLPKSVREYKLINYIKERTGKDNIYFISSKKRYNIDSLYNKLVKDKVKKAYVVGYSNAGKSMFIKAMVESKGLSTNIVVSSNTNTTLNNIKVDLKDLILIDTPGITSDKSISKYIELPLYRKLIATSEIKPKIHTLKKGFMILIDNIIRIENNNIDTCLSFYLSNNAKIKKIRKERDNILLDKELINIKCDTSKDIVIEGIGFIKVIKDCDLDIYTINKNIISLRDKLI